VKGARVKEIVDEIERWRAELPDRRPVVLLTRDPTVDVLALEAALRPGFTSRRKGC
jgi:hypothetical protein